jgi:hemolysin D
LFRRLCRRDDAHEFLPTMAEIEERPASLLGRFIFWIIIVTLAFFGTWMYVGKVDVVVSARGIVIPEGDIKILQPLDTGVVSSILCKEGDFVRKDQVLMEVDPSITVPELESKRKTLRLLELEQSRLRATAEMTPFVPDSRGHDRDSLTIQKEIHASAVAAQETQLQAKRAELARTRQELQSTAKERTYNEAMLKASQDKEKRLAPVLDIIARAEYEKVEADVLTYGNAVERLAHKVQELRHDEERLKNEITSLAESFRSTNFKEHAERQKQSTEIRAEIDKTSFRNEKQRILSPVEGHISNLYVHTVGGVVTPAQKLMAVVPANAPLVVKAQVLNKDIGFVKQGMPVTIKVDTFDFQKYGTLSGVVRNVSKHSTDDEKLGPLYEVFISADATELWVDGQKRSITSGMSLTAEIKVGTRRIIEFFIYPLIKYLDEGIKVR